jgi:hypothetical protein
MCNEWTDSFYASNETMNLMPRIKDRQTAQMGRETVLASADDSAWPFQDYAVCRRASGRNSCPSLVQIKDDVVDYVSGLGIDTLMQSENTRRVIRHRR